MNRERSDGMALNVGPGILAKMGEMGDQPIEDSQFKHNQDGTLLEECRGRKGRYIATNAGGDWETLHIPFDAA